LFALFLPLIRKREKTNQGKLLCANERSNESNLKEVSMKNESIKSRVVLQEVVSRILDTCVTSASRKNSLIINDVPDDMQVTTDEHMVATVFGTLLNAVITHTENTCIRISAKYYGRVVVLHLKETHKLNSSSFATTLRQIQQLAEKISGTVSISNNEGEATTIVFSFLNNLAAAA
jgi:hypothetical protein